MSLKAHTTTDCLGNITVHIDGGLDFENTGPLKRELEGILFDNPLSTVTLDLNSLDFVGSSGIGMFVDIIKTLNENKNKILLSNVKSEFLRVFKLYEFDALELMVNQFDNDVTENLGQRFANRKRTFEN